MINLFKNKEADGIVGRHFENTEAYYKYLDSRLFMCIEKQPVFCPHCGTLNVNPKDIRDLRYCPRCGHPGAVWGWNGESKLGMKLDVLINFNIKNSMEIVLMLNHIANKKGITIVWHTYDENNNISPLFLNKKELS